MYNECYYIYGDRKHINKTCYFYHYKYIYYMLGPKNSSVFTCLIKMCIIAYIILFNIPAYSNGNCTFQNSVPKYSMHSMFELSSNTKLLVDSTSLLWVSSINRKTTLKNPRLIRLMFQCNLKEIEVQKTMPTFVDKFHCSNISI